MNIDYMCSVCSQDQFWHGCLGTRWGGVGAGLRKEVITPEKRKGNTAKVGLEKEWPFKPQSRDFGFIPPSLQSTVLLLLDEYHFQVKSVLEIQKASKELSVELKCDFSCTTHTLGFALTAVHVSQGYSSRPTGWAHERSSAGTFPLILGQSYCFYFHGLFSPLLAGCLCSHSCYLAQTYLCNVFLSLHLADNPL